MAADDCTSETALKEDEDEVAQLKVSLQREKAAKRKMYSYLVKIAEELKSLRNESEQLINAAEYARKAWYEGGMWRGPNVLPGAGQHAVRSNYGSSSENNSDEGDTEAAATLMGLNGPSLVPRSPVSLSDLFLDLVTITAFSRIGNAIQDRGTIDLPILAYFAIFWQVWSKEASYSTRFDTTDISSHLETLLACFALLGGSLSAYSDFYSAGCTRIMGMAMLVSMLHVLLHLRVWYWFNEGGPPESVNYSVKRYAVFITIANSLESVTWGIGCLLPQDSEWRPWVILIGIILNLRLPRGFMPNDFHAACSKRGVLFILLLGFMLQSIVGVASPYFNYWSPSWDQYLFLFLSCFLLFMIKLLYVDDTSSISPLDHALLYNRAAGFCFYIGNFSLLVFTTVLGAGLNLLTQSFLAAAAALPSDAKNLVTGGFAGVVFSIQFIKSMHIRRIPTNTKHERMFFTAYFTQFVVTILIVYITARMCVNSENGILSLLMMNEIVMLATLVFLSIVLVAITWLDEAIELRIYKDGAEANQYRVQPFGFWMFCKHDEPLQLEAMALERSRARRLAVRSPLLGSSVINLSRPNSLGSGTMYNSFGNLGGSFANLGGIGGEV